MSEVSQPVAAALLGAGFQSRSRVLTAFLDILQVPFIGAGAENQRLQARLSCRIRLISGYWLSQASAGALRVVGRAI